MRKKDFETRIRKIKSDISNPFREEKLSHAFTSYLKSPYSKDAIKSIERFVLNKYKDEVPSVKLHPIFLEAAKYYRENRNV